MASAENDSINILSWNINSLKSKQTNQTKDMLHREQDWLTSWE